MATATITTCVDCETPVRPTKLRCDKCKPIRINALLDTPSTDDVRLSYGVKLSLTLAARNERAMT